MKSFKTHTGTTVALMRDGINTDQILPSRFLSRIEKKGFGQFLFANWRYNQQLGPDNGKENPQFELNQAGRQGASILITGDNFAGGSSREHAVWALVDYGFRVIIAGQFNDIFYTNTVKNSLLAITLAEDERQELAQLGPAEELTVNLEDQSLKSPYSSYHFSIDPEIKYKLLNGIDDIMETMMHQEGLEAYEAKWNDFYQAGPHACNYSDASMKSKLN